MEIQRERESLREMKCGTNLAYILSDAANFKETEYKVIQNQTGDYLIKCVKMLYNGNIHWLFGCRFLGCFDCYSFYFYATGCFDGAVIPVYRSDSGFESSESYVAGNPGCSHRYDLRFCYHYWKYNAFGGQNNWFVSDQLWYFL